MRFLHKFVMRRTPQIIMEKKDSTIMNTHHKPILTRLAALALTLTLLLSLCVSVNAEEGQPFTYTDSYQLVLGGGDAKPYACYSPFVPTLSYDGESVDGYSILFGIQNAYTGTVFEAAYCTDMPVDAKNVGYQRLNLTDSTYAAEHADKLRAVVLGSYPHIELDALRLATGLETLSMFEAITGTQLAVWKTAHGETVQVTDFMGKTTAQSYANSDSGHKDEAKAEYNAYQSGTDEHKARVKSNIEALYNYLMALPEREATSNTVSVASFTKRTLDPTWTQNDDGTYNVTVSTTINVSGGDLTLTAYVANGQYYTQKTNVTSGEYTLTIENIPAAYANSTVTLSLDGKQTVEEDVFLLDAEGIRGVSQSLIAPLSGELPVHAEIKCEPDRVLNIYKTEKDENGNRHPLANISFNVYYVGSVEDFRDGKLDIGTAPTEDDIKKYGESSNLVGTITTDENGEGSLNLRTEDGVYLVKELPNEAVEDESVAFFVSLPDWSRLDENGNPTYEITAEPKNTTVDEGPDIEKDVTEINNKHDTYDVGEEHPWIIRTGIPKTIASGKSYIITDTLDYRLTFKRLDKVELVDTVTEGAEALVLTEGADYTVTVGTTTDEDNHTVDMFTVSLTTVGMQKIAKAVGNDYADYELRTWFTAQINSNAQMGVEIPNQAEIEYTNNVGKTFTDESGVPEVHTGGAQLNKVNTSGDTLAGATFEVYRMATAEEINAETYDKELLIGETTYKMVKVSFYDNAKCDGEKVDSVTTDASGVACIYGLAYGEYYLVETKAPDGYNKLASPVKLTVNENSHRDANAVTVTNTSGTLLPSTGGIGTVPFTVMGLMLLAAAAVLLGRKKRSMI